MCVFVRVSLFPLITSPEAFNRNHPDTKKRDLKIKQLFVLKFQLNLNIPTPSGEMTSESAPNGSRRCLVSYCIW